MYFSSVRLHSPIGVNQAVQPSGKGGVQVSINPVKRSGKQFYLSTISPFEKRGVVCAFCFGKVLIPGTPIRKGWGWLGAFGVSKIEWMRPHPTPNNSFAPFWQIGNKPLPKASPLLQKIKLKQCIYRNKTVHTLNKTWVGNSTWSLEFEGWEWKISVEIWWGSLGISPVSGSTRSVE